jgi:hypothetical protein
MRPRPRKPWQKLLAATAVASACLTSQARASVKVYFPASGGCDPLFAAFTIGSTGAMPARFDRTRKNHSAAVAEAETHVHEFYRALMQSGKYELFNEKAFNEFIAEDKALPKDRSVFVEYRDPVTGEIEGVMRVFFGFKPKEFWRFIGIGNNASTIQPTSRDSRLPMQYHQLRVGSDFFKPMKIELGRLVTKEGADRVRIATELIYGLMDTVFAPMVGSRGFAVGDNGNPGIPNFVSPTIYVHTDAVRSVLYRRMGFRNIEVDRKATGLREGEFVLESSLHELYGLVKGHLDHAEHLYDINHSTGKLAEAIEATKAAVARYPRPESFSVGQRHLAELLLDNGQSAEALQHARLAVTANPSDPTAIATYLRALRVETGAFIPSDVSPTAQQERRTKWNDGQKILGNLPATKSPTQYVYGRAAIYNTELTFAYNQMLFEFGSGDVAAAMAIRATLKERLSQNWEGELFSARQTLVPLIYASIAVRRETLKIEDVVELPDESLTFRMTSTNPANDYNYLQALAHRNILLGATHEYHEACAQLADQASAPSLASYHRSAAAAIKSAK